MTSTADPDPGTPLLPDDGQQVGTVAKFFRALGDPTRLRLLEFLLDGEHSVSDCVAHVGLAQGRVSTHLACLADCGYVQARREGRWCYYRVTDPRVAELVTLARSLSADNCTALATCERIDKPRTTQRGS
jgi:ArsR family transcriptional regulator, cadmium/lead-responsive transcriptional repressor